MAFDSIGFSQASPDARTGKGVRVTEPALDEVGAIILKARNLITDPAKWTQTTSARDANGEECRSNSRVAVRWCIIGAVEKVTRRGSEIHGPVLERILKTAGVEAHADYEMNFLRVASLNDRFELDTHDNVLALLDRAAAGETK